MFAGMHWFSVLQNDARAAALYARHYSSGKNGRKLSLWLRYGIAGPGETMTLLLVDASALFVWIKQEYRMDDQAGVNCAVFRNESGILSSTLNSGSGAVGLGALAWRATVYVCGPGDGQECEPWLLLFDGGLVSAAGAHVARAGGAGEGCADYGRWVRC